MTDAPLVVGVDVGSQGTCAEALELDGTLVASTYEPHELSYPQAGWAEQDPSEWTVALVATLARMREQTAGREIAALSFGSQLDGLVAARADGTPLRPALIWCDRRAGEECAAARIEAPRLRELTGCNLDPGHVAPKIAWVARHEPDAYRGGRRLRAAGLVGGVAGVGRARRRSLERVVGESCSTRGRARGRRRRARRSASTWRGCRPCARPTPCSARSATGCATRPGSTARRWWSWARATRWRRRWAPAWSSRASVCDVMGTAEPVCAVVAEPAFDPTGVVELHPHADPDTWLLENPGWLSGGAYRWFRDELGGPEAARAKECGADVYELLNELAQCAPPGAGGVTWLPALAGAMAPEWNADARAAWFGMTAAHGRAHLARALLEGNALALRDVIEAIAGAGHPPSDVVCVGGGAKGRLLLELRAHITGLPVCRPEDVETTARGAAMLAAAGAGLHPSVADAARAMAGARQEPRAARRRAARRLRRPAPPAPGAVRRAAAAVQRGHAVTATMRDGRSTRRRGGGRSRRPPPATSTCSSSAAASPARARRSTPPRAACASRWSRRATSPPAPRARRASSSTAACATSRWATSASCARRCASASCCSRGSRPTSSSRSRSCGRCAAAPGSAPTSAPG